MYLALIGDIVQSRSVARRRELQEQLNSLLEGLNAEFSSELAAGFTITLGDEFQGVLARPEVLMPILNRLRFGLAPVRVRFGLGLGDISTALQPRAIGADGPAFHMARAMINALKDAENAKQRGSGYARMASQSGGCELINAAFGLLGFVESRWTDKQKELISHYLNTQGSQRELAKVLNISQSNVQRRFKAAGFYDYQTAQRAITESISALWEAP